MTIFELLKQTNYPYYRYGSVPAETVRNFFTFNNIDTVGILPADNEVNLKADVYDIVFYTDEPEKIYTAIEDFCKAARGDGWTIQRLPYDIVTDDKKLYGRLARVSKIEYNTIRA